MIRRLNVVLLLFPIFAYGFMFGYDQISPLKRTVNNLPKYSIDLSLVKIFTEDSVASGFVFAENGAKSYVLTNKHVCRTRAGGIHTNFKLVWTFLNREDAYGKVFNISYNHDLCIIEFNGTDIPHAKLSSFGPSKKEKLYSVGNPGNYWGIRTSGVVQNLFEYDSFPDHGLAEYYVKFNGVFRAGYSGSPVYNALDEVVGVAAVWNESNLRDSLFVNGKYIKEFVGELYDRN